MTERGIRGTSPATPRIKGLLAVLVALTAAACGSATQGGQPAGGSADRSTPSTPASPDTSREAAVYSAVLERYLGTELSVGGPADVGTVYILTQAGLDEGSTGKPVQLDVGARREISSALRPQYRVQWVGEAEGVVITGRTDCDPAAKRDVLIALGAIPSGDVRVEVTLDGHADCGLAGGWVYQLTRDGGSWTVGKHRASWQS